MSNAAAKITLSGDHSVPVYQQIKDAIRQMINSGAWQAGQLIPSENQLSEELGASRMTINRPLRELTSEGLLRRVHGLGTFVAEPPRQAHLLELKSIAEEITQQGKTHRARVLELTEVTADTAMSQRLHVSKSTTLFKIVLVHFQDDTPIQLESRYVNPAMVGDFMHVDFASTTPAEYLISIIRPDEIEHLVEAIMPDEFIAIQLDMPSSEPCLKLSRRTWKDGQVVTAADLIYPSSRYGLGARFSPPSQP